MINSKEALLCLLIYFLFINGVLVLFFALFLTPKTVQQVVPTSNVILYVQLLFPIPGWVANALIGRYKVIRVGIFISLIANVVTICAIITIFNISSSSKAVQIIIYIGLGVSALGYAAMSANIIPFILDQYIGASGEELSGLIHWTLWTSILGSFILKVIDCLVPGSTISTGILYVCLGISIVFSIASSALVIAGQKRLDTTHQITNPIKLILRVLNYARKIKHPRNRSALTY